MLTKLHHYIVGALLAASFCLPAHALLITEIHADPDSSIAGDANNDGIRSSSEDEFIEFLNTSSVAIDLSGWSISDSVTTRHIFADGTIIDAGQALVIFGGGSLVGSFGNALIETASSGSLSLNNSGDVISLYDDELQLITSYEYSNEANQNESITRVATDPLADLTSHSSLSNTSLLFSPGTTVDGSAYIATASTTGVTPIPEPPILMLATCALLIGLFKQKRLSH